MTASSQTCPPDVVAEKYTNLAGTICAPAYTVLRKSATAMELKSGEYTGLLRQQSNRDGVKKAASSLYSVIQMGVLAAFGCKPPRTRDETASKLWAKPPLGLCASARRDGVPP